MCQKYLYTIIMYFIRFEKKNKFPVLKLLWTSFYCFVFSEIVETDGKILEGICETHEKDSHGLIQKELICKKIKNGEFENFIGQPTQNGSEWV